VSWLGRYVIGGKEYWPGYGSYPEVSLADARAKRDADCARIHAGGNPVAERKQAREKNRIDERPRKKFREFSETFIADHESSWLNPVHRKQWSATLKVYVYPVIGDFSCDEITSEHAVKMLRPIWYTKAETARRVRGRCEKIWDAAKVLKLCSGENPFRLAGNINLLLPTDKKQKRKVKHHPALDYEIVPAYIKRLRSLETVSAKALEFAILTWARTGDIIGQKGRDDDRPPMMWKHVDLDAQIWTIPATKTDAQHRVPLSDAAMAVLRSMQGLDPEIVFPSPDRKGRSLSNGAMLALLDRMGHGDVTVHGMRSAARDWAAECSNFPSEVCEMALAHAIESDVEAAYRRGDLFVKRRHLMEAWAKYCGSAQAGNNVVDLPTQRETA
jgi:integrase